MLLLSFMDKRIANLHYDRWICRGTTDLDGTYGSYIEVSGNQTLISIEMRWDGCSYYFE